MQFFISSSSKYSIIIVHKELFRTFINNVPEGREHQRTLLAKVGSWEVEVRYFKIVNKIQFRNRH